MHHRCLHALPPVGRLAVMLLLLQLLSSIILRTRHYSARVYVIFLCVQFHNLITRISWTSGDGGAGRALLPLCSPNNSTLRARARTRGGFAEPPPPSPIASRSSLAAPVHACMSVRLENMLLSGVVVQKVFGQQNTRERVVFMYFL